MINHLIDGGTLDLARAPLSAGSSNQDGTSFDMAGYQGILFMVAVGAITANAVTSVLVQTSPTGTGDWSDVDDSEIDIADDDDNGLLYIDILEPAARFVRLAFRRGTANAAFRASFAFRYRAGEIPAPVGADEIGRKRLVGDDAV